MIADPLAIPGRLPPHDIQAEEAVIGSILIDGDAITRVRHVLSPEDFYRQANRVVYEAAIKVHDAGERVDHVTVAAQLEVDERLHDVGGSAFLAHTVSVVPTSVHAEHYARIVYRTATCRRLIKAGADITEIGYANEADVETTLTAAAGVLTEIPQRHRTQVRSIGDVVEENWDVIELQIEQGFVGSAIPSRLRDLDDILGGGFYRGDLTVVGARTSMGKTQFLLNVIYQAAECGFRCVYLSAEQGQMSVIYRLASIHLGYPVKHLSDTRRAEKRNEIREAVKFVATLPIDITDTAAFTSHQAHAYAVERSMRHGGIDLLAVDYLQRLRDRPRHNQARYELVGEMVRTLKQSARSLDCAVLLAAQLNRETQRRADHVPVLTDLRESGDIEQDADNVLLLRRIDAYVQSGEIKAHEPIAQQKQNVLDVYVGKQRDGETGVVSLFFDPAKGRIHSLASQAETPKDVIAQRHREWEQRVASKPSVPEEVTQLDLSAPGVDTETGEVKA